MLKILACFLDVSLQLRRPQTNAGYGKTLMLVHFLLTMATSCFESSGSRALKLFKVSATKASVLPMQNKNCSAWLIFVLQTDGKYSSLHKQTQGKINSTLDRKLLPNSGETTFDRLWVSEMIVLVLFRLRGDKLSGAIDFSGNVANYSNRKIIQVQFDYITHFICRKIILRKDLTFLILRRATGI